MFERFTRNARDVVEDAVGHAERTGSAAVDEEHLLLALLDRRAGRAAFALAALGLEGRRDSVARALGEARRRGGLSLADIRALSDLGIDVSEIVSRVEEAHGEGALERGRGRGVRRWSGHRPFTSGAKDLLARSLRIALARRDRSIGDEHLLLALTTGPGVIAEVLGDHGVTTISVERVLGGGAGEAKAS